VDEYVKVPRTDKLNLLRNRFHPISDNSYSGDFLEVPREEECPMQVETNNLQSSSNLTYTSNDDSEEEMSPKITYFEAFPIQVGFICPACTTSTEEQQAALAKARQEMWRFTTQKKERTEEENSISKEEKEEEDDEEDEV